MQGNHTTVLNPPSLRFNTGCAAVRLQQSVSTGIGLRWWMVDGVAGLGAVYGLHAWGGLAIAMRDTVVNTTPSAVVKPITCSTK